jgi:hypothetical protein
VTGYLRTAVVCRALAVLAVGGTVWLAGHGHPLLAAVTAWVVFLGVFFGGRFHTAHRRTPAIPVPGTRRTTAPTVRTRP